jgi:ABC-2 type transport system ATP-binding protein
VARHEQSGSQWTLWVGDSDAFVRELVRAGTPYADLRVRSASLEDAFLSLTRDHGSARGPISRVVSRDHYEVSA